jgi:hypothetical protein
MVDGVVAMLEKRRGAYRAATHEGRFQPRIDAVQSWYWLACCAAGSASNSISRTPRASTAGRACPASDQLVLITPPCPTHAAEPNYRIRHGPHQSECEHLVTVVEVVDGSRGVAERSGDPLEGVGVRSHPSSIALVECVGGRDLLSGQLEVEHAEVSSIRPRRHTTTAQPPPRQSCRPRRDLPGGWG